jgi:hypothetical protein
MLRLRNLNQMPPGGYAYVQAETGMKFDGNTPFRAQSFQIAAHRKANGLPRSTVQEAAADLEATVCARHPGVCFDNTKPNDYGLIFPKAKAGGCASCGGRRA